MAKRVKITTSTGNVYRFDVVMNESIDEVLTLTSYPVQDGTPVTDHAYKEPEVVTINVRVSDIKLKSYDNSFDSATSRTEEANRIIKSWQNNVELLTIQTKFDLFTTMVLVGMNTVNDTSSNRNVYNATLTFRKLRIATIETITVGPFENDVIASYESPYQNNGNVEGETVVSEVVDIAGATIGGTIAGAAIGAAIGGIVGSIVPGAGTIAGAIVGAKIGAIVGGSSGFLTKSWKKAKGLFGGGN